MSVFQTDQVTQSARRVIEREGVAEFIQKRGNHTAKIVFETKLFDSHKHKTAGDGAGVYEVIWVLRKDGRHTRFTESGGDCRFLNFECSPDGN
jgi:hypothetical protein